MSRSTTGRRHEAGHWLLLILVLLFFLIPLVSLFLYSIHRPLAATDAWTFDSWATLLGGSDGSVDLTELGNGLANSAIAAVITVAIMLIILLPTMVITRLSSHRMGKVVEFVCMLPLAIPAIALVVGLGPIYRFLSTTILSTDGYWLALAYVILVLPYAYRALDAGLRQLDVRTLFEASQTFGSSWLGTMVKVIIPNLRTAILSACFVSVAVVLGEYTLAALLGRSNLQNALFVMNQNDSFIAAAMALLAMVFAIVLLMSIDVVSAAANKKYRKGSKR